MMIENVILNNMIEQQDAYKKTLDYFKDDTLAADVFVTETLS